MVRKLIPFLMLVPLTLSLVAIVPPRRSASTRAVAAAAKAPADARRFLLEGQGAPRASQADCLRELPEFEKALGAADIKLIEHAKCVALEEDDHSFAPAFRGVSSHEYDVIVVKGPQFNSLSHCELQRLKLAEDSTDKSRVVESLCSSVTVHIYSDHSNEMYVPVSVVRTNRTLRAAAE